jgi:hypothetical protein
VEFPDETALPHIRQFGICIVVITASSAVPIAQETVAQNGQAEGCVFLLTQIISLSVLAVD